MAKVSSLPATSQEPHLGHARAALNSSHNSWPAMVTTNTIESAREKKGGKRKHARNTNRIEMLHLSRANRNFT